jgi:hypothetical protein
MNPTSSSSLNAYDSHDCSQDQSSQLISVRVAKSALGSVLVASLLLISATQQAHADDSSKVTKVFELCMSKCVYQQTRPPPINSDNDRLQVVRERGDIIRTCKSECAVNKEQLMLGKPKQPKVASDPVYDKPSS